MIRQQNPISRIASDRKVRDEFAVTRSKSWIYREGAKARKNGMPNHRMGV